MAITPLTNPFSGNVFAQFLEEPGLGQRAAFFGALPAAQTPNRQAFFQNQYPGFIDEFLGLQAQDIFAGRTPRQFAPFAQQFPFAQRFAATPPSMRPGTPRRFFAPTARSFFF